MKLWMQMMVFIALGLATMSSQSTDRPLVIPEADGAPEVDVGKRPLSREKLSKAITDEFSDIVAVYDITFGPAEFYDIDFKPKREERIANGLMPFVPLNHVVFVISFTIKTTTNMTFSNVQCRAFLDLWLEAGEVPTLHLSYCGNDQVVFKRELNILLNEIELRNGAIIRK